MLCLVCDYSNSKLKGKQYEQKTSATSCKTEIKFFANPGLAGNEKLQKLKLKFWLILVWLTGL